MRARPGSSRALQTINNPILSEKVWWASSQLLDPKMQQRKEVEDKELVRQNWLRRLRPRHSRDPRVDHEHDKNRRK